MSLADHLLAMGIGISTAITAAYLIRIIGKLRTDIAFLRIIAGYKKEGEE